MSRYEPTGVDGQGYKHRTHRSKKGRTKNAMGKKVLKRMLKEREDKWERRSEECIV